MVVDMTRWVIDYEFEGHTDFTCVDGKDEFEAIGNFYKKITPVVGKENAMKHHIEKVTAR